MALGFGEMNSLYKSSLRHSDTQAYISLEEKLLGDNGEKQEVIDAIVSVLSNDFRQCLGKGKAFEDALNRLSEFSGPEGRRVSLAYIKAVFGREYRVGLWENVKRLAHIWHLKKLDKTIYEDSLFTARWAAVISFGMKYTEGQENYDTRHLSQYANLKEIIVGAMLHDIGIEKLKKRGVDISDTLRSAVEYQALPDNPISLTVRLAKQFQKLAFKGGEEMLAWDKISDQLRESVYGKTMIADVSDYLKRPYQLLYRLTMCQK